MRKAFKADFYRILLIFLVCGCAGWIYETALALLGGQGISTRGDLFILSSLSLYWPALAGTALGRARLVLGLPIIEIYGLGSLLAILGLGRVTKRPVPLFFLGAGTLTLLELMSSYLSQWLLGRQFWDYSKNFLNFQGRICLLSAIAWGVGTLLAVKLAGPILDRLHARWQNSRVYRATLLVLAAVALACAVSKYWLFPALMQ